MDVTCPPSLASLHTKPQLPSPYANEPPPRYANDPEYATQMTDPEIQTVRNNFPLERAADQDKDDLRFHCCQAIKSQKCSLKLLTTFRTLIEVGTDLRVEWLCPYFAHSLHQNCIDLHPKCIHTIVTCVIYNITHLQALQCDHFAHICL